MATPGQIEVDLTVSWTDVLIRKLTSRKFWAMVIAVITALAGLLTDQATFGEFLAAVIAAIAAYQVGEGLADSRRGA